MRENKQGIVQYCEQSITKSNVNRRIFNLLMTLPDTVFQDAYVVIIMDNTADNKVQ